MTYSKHPLIRAQMEKASMDFRSVAMSAPVMGAGAALAVEMGGGLLSSGVRKLKDMYDRNQSYKGMLELSPELRGKDQAVVKRYFNSLHRLNPHFMNDPLIASGIVYQAIENQETALGGLHAAPMAVSRMAGDLVRNRSDFASALQRESDRGPGLASRLAPLVQKGFEEADKIRMGLTPEAAQIRALEEATERHDKSLKALNLKEFNQMRRENAERFTAARADQVRQIGEGQAQIREQRARLAGIGQQIQTAMHNLGEAQARRGLRQEIEPPTHDPVTGQKLKP